MITTADVQGHWVRRWIKAPGFEDHTTRVHWMQVGEVYADIRVPLERPEVTGVTRLSDLSAQALSQLATAEGFAGHVTLSGSECTWHREINWHGTPEAPDIGAISFDDAGQMIEVGVHAEYTELWELRDGGTSLALRLTCHGYLGYLVARGDLFVLGIGTPGKPSTHPLVTDLNAGQTPDGIAALFDGVHAMGHWSGSTAIAALSTDPFAEGTEIANITGDMLTWHRTGFDGTRTDIALQIETLPP